MVPRDAAEDDDIPGNRPARLFFPEARCCRSGPEITRMIVRKGKSERPPWGLVLIPSRPRLREVFQDSKIPTNRSLPPAYPELRSRNTARRAGLSSRGTAVPRWVILVGEAQRWRRDERAHGLQRQIGVTGPLDRSDRANRQLRASPRTGAFGKGRAWSATWKKSSPNVNTERIIQVLRRRLPVHPHLAKWPQKMGYRSVPHSRAPRFPQAPEGGGLADKVSILITIRTDPDRKGDTGGGWSGGIFGYKVFFRRIQHPRAGRSYCRFLVNTMFAPERRRNGWPPPIARFCPKEKCGSP